MRDQTLRRRIGPKLLVAGISLAIPLGGTGCSGEADGQSQPRSARDDGAAQSAPPRDSESDHSRPRPDAKSADEIAPTPPEAVPPGTTPRPEEVHRRAQRLLRRIGDPDPDRERAARARVERALQRLSGSGATLRNLSAEQRQQLRLALRRLDGRLEQD